MNCYASQRCVGPRAPNGLTYKKYWVHIIKLISTRFVGSEVTSNRSSAIFEVLTKSGPRYLRIDRTPQHNGDRMVVVVDAGRFLHIWRNASTGEPLSVACRGHDASDLEKRFAQSCLHPLRIPVVGALTRNRPGFMEKLLTRCLPHPKANKPLRSYCIDLVSGRQRALWLLANDATSFPIECAIADAQELYRLVGVQASVVTSVDELTPPLASVERQLPAAGSSMT